MTFKNTIKENNQYPMITKTTIKKKTYQFIVFIKNILSNDYLK